MGPFGVRWSIFIIWCIGGPGIIILSQVITRTKWWKDLMDYFYSWNAD